MNPRNFDFGKVDFKSKEEVIEYFLKGGIVAKMGVLERFKAGDDSVVPQDILDYADLVWMVCQNTTDR